MAKVSELTEDQLRTEVASWRANAAATLNALMSTAAAWAAEGRDDDARYVRVNMIMPQRAALREALSGEDLHESHCGEACGKPILDGEWVHMFEDVGEIHCNCENPSQRPDDIEGGEDCPAAFQHADWFTDDKVAETLAKAEAFLLAADDEGDLLADEAACRICGCTEEDACSTPAGFCTWVEPDLCSAPSCVAAAAAARGADA